ncbi:hypothetical protein [Haemophilus paracuniculus]|nr:hypothetical protein [Haemophilus paracuniculus]
MAVLPPQAGEDFKTTTKPDLPPLAGEVVEQSETEGGNTCKRLD